MEVPLRRCKNDTLGSRSWINILWYVPYCVTNAMQLFTIMGTSFLQSCWSCNALPSVPAAFSIAVCQTVKSNLVCPWMYSVLWSLKSTPYYNFTLLKITFNTDCPKIPINVILSHTLKKTTNQTKKDPLFSLPPTRCLSVPLLSVKVTEHRGSSTNSVFLFQLPSSPIRSL